jgi:hypothetical protein
MGPISLDWYRDRGLTRLETKTATEDSMLYNTGDTYTTETITTEYSAGRIDVNTGDEISVPPMLRTDWNKFSDWLDDVQTMAVWSLEQLVHAYEHQTKNTIHWIE